MDTGIKVDISGLLNKSQRAQMLLASGDLIKAVGQRQLKWIDDNFRSHGASVGGWKPLSPFTLEHRKHGGNAPLQDTGTLRASFNARVIGSDTVKVGSPLPFASYHEQGTGPIFPINAKMLAIPGPHGVSFLRKTAGIPKRRMLPDIRIAKELAISIIQARVKQLEV